MRHLQQIARWRHGASVLMLMTGLTSCDASVPERASHAPVDPQLSATATTSDETCLDSRTAVAVSWEEKGLPSSGTHSVAVLEEPGLPGHTVYRPASLSGNPLPIVVWGNGGCGTNGLAVAEFLAEIASQGFLVISNGVPKGEGEDNRDGTSHLAALDWAVRQDAHSCSGYFNKLDESHVAVMGYSCGGLMALNAAGDPRVSTVAAMNSGLLTPDESLYASLHTPVAYFNGGKQDIAYENGLRDFQSISHVPVYHANLPVGHGGTYGQDNGGEYASVAAAWLNWHLKGDQGSSGRSMFLGDDCRICQSDWVVEHKNF